MQAQDYRSRALAAEARVTELEEELAAWRAYGAASAPIGETDMRRLRVQWWLRHRERSAGTPARAGLLLTLLDRPGAIFRREALIRATRLSGADPDGEPNLKIVDVHLVHLRKALAREGISITCIWGHGFRLDPDQAARLSALIFEDA